MSLGDTARTTAPTPSGRRPGYVLCNSHPVLSAGTVAARPLRRSTSRRNGSAKGEGPLARTRPSSTASVAPVNDVLGGEPAEPAADPTGPRAGESAPIADLRSYPAFPSYRNRGCSGVLTFHRPRAARGRTLLCPTLPAPRTCPLPGDCDRQAGHHPRPLRPRRPGRDPPARRQRSPGGRHHDNRCPLLAHTDGRGRLAAGGCATRPAALKQVADAHHRLALVWADGGYTGSLVDYCFTALALVLAIVKRSDGQKGFVVLPKRWIVERLFAHLMHTRRLTRSRPQPA
ncbi:transposase [Streptomyces sp. NPDC000878]